MQAVSTQDENLKGGFNSFKKSIFNIYCSPSGNICMEITGFRAF